MSEKYICVGYNSQSKGYRLYSLKISKVMISGMFFFVKRLHRIGRKIRLKACCSWWYSQRKNILLMLNLMKKPINPHVGTIHHLHSPNISHTSSSSSSLGKSGLLYCSLVCYDLIIIEKKWILSIKGKLWGKKRWVI